MRRPTRALLAAALALGACTPPPAPERRGPAASDGGSAGQASAPTGNAVWAARQSIYAQLGTVIFAPTGAVARGRTKPAGEQPYSLEDKIYIRRAFIDVAPHDPEGSRRITIVVRWEDALGGSEDELCEGYIINGPRGPELRWTRIVTLPSREDVAR